MKKSELKAIIKECLTEIDMITEGNTRQEFISFSNKRYAELKSAGVDKKKMAKFEQEMLSAWNAYKDALKVTPK